MSLAFLDDRDAPQRDGNQHRGGKRIFPGQHKHLDLTHVDGPRGFAQMETTESGVRTTRFKKGFERRQETTIQPHAERRKGEAAKAEASTAHLERRRVQLSEYGQYNGFNPISGVYEADKIRGLRPQARYLSDRPSAELLKSGEITIRNSHFRFYTPLPSGDEHDRRQKQLVSEGLLKPKCSSVLGIGRADAKSYGVEDQFSHSNYGNARKQVEGLYEKTEPGRYTPRKTNNARTGGELFAGTWRNERP
ncbi:hypothetical protein M885DRAFT_506117 [Pelagophyceae sp. CCMP2097]|nr:hypothetical protein M885DRAFT_506117 [Pelagophyceae sp. CCMP2097]